MDAKLDLQVDQLARMWGIDPDTVIRVTVSKDRKTLTFTYDRRTD